MKLRLPVRGIFSSLLDVLFPPQCGSCRALLSHNELFCPTCWSAVHLIRHPMCPLCGKYHAEATRDDHLCGECLKKRRPFRSARAAALFEGPVMEAIHRVKYRGDLGLVKPLVSRLIRHIDTSQNWDLLIPVPLHPSRLRERGFNQSALLAREMSRNMDIPADLFSLKKITATPPQVGLTMKERIKNVRGAYHVAKKEKIKEKRILLVDDVLTTGATVSECARVLRKAGAKSVDVLTLARTL